MSSPPRKPRGVTRARPLVSVRMGKRPSTEGVPGHAGIYRIVCLPMRKTYVGQSFDLALRWRTHQEHLWAGAHTNTALQEAFRCYGPRAFVFEVLERVVPSALALTLAEQRWMEKERSVFNVRPAGTDHYLITKAKARAARLGPDAAFQAAASLRPLKEKARCFRTKMNAPVTGCFCFRCKLARELYDGSR